MIRCILGLLLALFLLPAHAQTRAWTDRDRINANETVTLNIKTDGMARPDYDPLLRDFNISGRSSRTEMDDTGVHSLYAVALQPRRAGRLTIPALRVGNAATQPLTLLVEGAPAPAPARAGDDVFIESEADDDNPYVQQTVGWVVRLYSAAPLISGQLDQAAPEGASLQQVGQDARYTREVAGRRYEVIERRYQLVPERSGQLVVPGAAFEGRGTGGFFDELFGDRGGALSARAPDRALQVRAAPANAPQPWLPLRNLQLRYATTPGELRTGSAGSLVIEAIADGATAAQMPELQLPPVEGIQAFADPVQADETFRQGRPQVKLSRRFSLVPSRPGVVSLPGMRLDWWDVGAGARRTAELPPMRLRIAAGAAAASSDAAPGVGASPAMPTVEASGAHRGWVLATLLFAALWLFTLVCGFHQRTQQAAHSVPAGSENTTSDPGRGRGDLKRALQTGDLGDVAETLRAMCTPPAQSIDELISRLDEPAQREAVHALQQARWGDGDGTRARAMLRAAFAHGPRWRRSAASARSMLPPLYPE